MKKLSINPPWFSDDLTDIIFENRNKEYGAYDLRKYYNQRLKKAFFITASSISLFLFLITIILRTNHDDLIFKPQPTPFITPIKKFEIIANPTTTPPTYHRMQNNETPPSIIQDTLRQPEMPIDTTSIAPGAGTTSDRGISTPDAGVSNNPASGQGIVSDIPADDSGGQPFMVTPTIFPSFPGGQKALSRYLQNHLNSSRLPETARGKIYLSFIVNKDGTITAVEILKDNVGFGCGEDAARVLEHMPKWTPGIYNDHTVNVKMILPISIEGME